MHLSAVRRTKWRIPATVACAVCLVQTCTQLTDDGGTLPFDPTKGVGGVVDATPTALNLQHRLGEPRNTTSFRVWNEGDASLDLSIEIAGAPWLSVSPGAYAFPAPAPDSPNDTLTVTVTYPTTELTPSATPYEAVIRLCQSDAVADSIVVLLTVVDSTVVDGSPVYAQPDTLRLTHVVGGPAPVGSLRVWTDAPTNTTVTVEPDGAGSWITGGGLVAVAAGDTATTAVSVEPSRLAAIDSVYTGRLLVRGDGLNPRRDTCVVLLRVISCPPGMVLVPARDSVFSMGSTYRLSERPAHDVRFTYDFWLDSTEVTQASYDSLMGTNPSSAVGPSYPVENVTWFDAVLYCNARSRRDGFDTVYDYAEVTDGVAGNGSVLNGLTVHMERYGYRLPTEAEWEYAAKGGLGGMFPWGNAIAADTIDRYVWYEENSGGHPHPVAQKAPNPFRLYDIGGNVWEWVNDRWQDSYQNAAGVDPYVEHTVVDTVLVRGGFYDSPWFASLSPVEFRTSCRSPDCPGDRYASVGFRCALPGHISTHWR